MFRWKDYSRIWVTQRNKCTSSRLDESELRLTTTMHCVLTFASCKAVFALNASSQHHGLQKSLTICLSWLKSSSCFWKWWAETRTQISCIIVCPKKLLSRILICEKYYKTCIYTPLSKADEAEDLTLCEQSLLNPAPMLHCALFCFVARMKKEFYSNVVIVLFIYTRRRWGSWMGGWMVVWDGSIFANGLVDGMKKTCKDGWYFGILSLLHFQGH